jgi:hypothetical protein
MRRPVAVGALRSLGRTAEREVVRYLFHKDDSARRPVRGLLRDYGTPDAVLFQQALDDLSSPEVVTRRLAVDAVARRKPAPRRKRQVALALDPLLGDRDALVKRTALRGLEVGWATRDNVPTLIRGLGDPVLKDPAIAILGRLKDDRAIKPLALRLLTPDRGKVIKALQPFGRRAEQDVLFYLRLANDVGAFKDICRLIGNIGTRAVSVPVLKQLSKDPLHKPVAGDCYAAIKKIQSRR